MPTLLLAVDTSGKNGGLALVHVRPDQTEIEIVEVVPLAGGAFSAQMVPQIAVLLKNHGYTKDDLAAFAVVSGPGSFTGLRVGLAAIKALAEVLQKPIAAISLLEALAWNFKAHDAMSGRILAALDAGRGDLYIGDYELESGLSEKPQVRRKSECLLSQAALAAELNTCDGTATFVVTPDARPADTIREIVEMNGSAAAIQVVVIPYPDTATIARIGWQHLLRGQTVRPEELEANYLRQSDAEIFAKPKV